LAFGHEICYKQHTVQVEREQESDGGNCSNGLPNMIIRTANINAHQGIDQDITGIDYHAGQTCER
jgi:hypothetical protein